MTPALSIRQPWAWAILYAGKDIENRTRSTRLRGRILIHAGVAFDGGNSRDNIDDALDQCAGWAREAGIAPPSLDQLSRGGIVGAVEIADCVKASGSPWFFGPYGLILRNATPLPFRPCKGRLGFFDVDECSLYGAHNERAAIAR